MSFIKKTFLLIIFLAFGYATVMMIFVTDEQEIDFALADANDKIDGYAWNDMTGWISFNCTTDNSCASTDYGVTIDLATGQLSGYAWSSNLGWIYFGPDNGSVALVSNAPGNPFQWAIYNSSNQQISGWAKILSLGDEGWIKMRKYSADGGTDYGVAVSGSGDFTGYAWNSNIGWISFNCLNDDCSTSDYKITGDIIGTPQNVIVSQASSDSCHKLKVNWDIPVLGASGFKVYRQNGASWDTACSWIVSTSNVCNDTTSLDIGTTYTYKVRACNDVVCALYSDSAEASESTKAVCQILSDDVGGKNECPDINTLTWIAPAGTVNYYNIYRCDATGQIAGYCDDSENYVKISVDGAVTTLTYADSVTEANASHRFYYIIAGYNTSADEGAGEEAEWSDALGPYVACPKSPLFKEVSPN